jgi:hypothetical protein
MTEHDYVMLLSFLVIPSLILFFALWVFLIRWIFKINELIQHLNKIHDEMIHIHLELRKLHSTTDNMRIFLSSIDKNIAPKKEPESSKDNPAKSV